MPELKFATASFRGAFGSSDSHDLSRDGPRTACSSEIGVACNPAARFLDFCRLGLSGVTLGVEAGQRLVLVVEGGDQV